jgi:hypothetical protein
LAFSRRPALAGVPVAVLGGAEGWLGGTEGALAGAEGAPGAEQADKLTMMTTRNPMEVMNRGSNRPIAFSFHIA